MMSPDLVQIPIEIKTQFQTGLKYDAAVSKTSPRLSIKLEI